MINDFFVYSPFKLGPQLKILSLKMLDIADSCFCILPFATLSDLETAADKAKYLADMPVLAQFLMELEREHSAPAKDAIPSSTGHKP